MGVTADTQIALETRLSTVSGLPSNVAYQNTGYEPTIGTEWVRPTLLRAPSSMVDLSGLQAFPGVFQIDVMVPTDAGSNRLNTLLDAIYDHFKAARELSEGDTVVNVQEITVLPSQRFESYYMGSIEVNYICYST